MEAQATTTNTTTNTKELTIQDKFKLYLNLHKEIAEFRKYLNTKKKLVQNLEDEIKEYMKDNEMDSINCADGEIILGDFKVSQTYKKDTIVEKLTEKLKGNNELAENLADSIITNKVFLTSKKLKAKLKKEKVQ